MFVCPECGSSLAHPGFCPSDGTALRDRGDDAILGTEVGSYRIAKLLGVGGMGRVYLAIHPSIGSRVAVKVLARECADRPELVERFFSEARAVNLIRHENIVNVLDLAKLPDGRPYIVMEFLDGAPLSSVIQTHGPLPLGGLARLIGEVLDALSRAHAKGIIHRDLKPDNIFVTPAGRGKVLDFGIAKLQPELMSGAQTRTGSLMGTPHYMSPEQALGRAVDARTDLYAVGIILFECATGQRPFNAEGLYDLLRKHVDEPPPRPSALRPDLLPSYEAVILRALAKDPLQRFQSAGELAGALSQAAADLAPQSWTTITPGTGPRALSIGPGSSPSAHPASGGQWNPSSGYAPGHAPPVYGQPTSPTTLSAVAGQAGNRSASTGRGLKLGLAFVAVAALGVAAFALTRGGDDPAPAQPPVADNAIDNLRTLEALAKDSHDRVGDLFAAAGAGGGDDGDDGDDSAAGDDSDDDDDDDSAAGSGKDSDHPGKPAQAGGDELVEMMRAAAGDLSGLSKEQRALVEKQFELAADQLKHLDPASRKLVKQQLELSAAQIKEAGLVRQQDGSMKYVPPGTEKPAGYSATNFDVSGFLPSAEIAARKKFSDAALVRIDSIGVGTTGTVDFTLSDAFYVIYTFESPSRGKRPDDLPKGAPHKPTCKVQVWVDPNGVRAQVVEGWACEGSPIKAPRCTTAAVWKKAMAKGAPKANAVANISTWGDGKAQRWMFSVEDDYSGILPDDC